MLFWYKKTIKDKNGQDIEVEDAFNTDYIIRVYCVSEDKTLVLLDDGHEQADYFEYPKPNGKGTELKRERRWVQSEITLNEEYTILLKEFMEKEREMIL